MNQKNPKFKKKNALAILLPTVVHQLSGIQLAFRV